MSKLILPLSIERMQTPIGEMILVTDPQGRLRAVDWTDYEERMLRLLTRHYGATGFMLAPGVTPYALVEGMQRYFAGDLAALAELPVETAGTPFQRKVWSTLKEIPCGASISYTELAKRIGRSNAVRAVGLANGANPIGVVVPCHRVVGANGSLTGYGGGLERKRWLLQHESSPRHLASDIA